jgi:putative oxidoreductase
MKHMTPTDLLFLAGRLLLGGYFLMAGFNHFRNRKMMTGYAASKGVPMAALAIPGTGLMLAVGGLSILTGIYPFVGIALLSLFLVGVTPKMHDFWNAKDPMAKMAEQSNFMKNAGLLGAILMLAAIGPAWSLALNI